MKLIAILVATVVISTDAICQNKDKEAFETGLYGISQVTHFGLDTERFRGLSPADGRDLTQCRDVLIGMFQAIEKGGETLKYVTPELARRYRNADALAGSIIDRETSIIAAGVTDFSFMNGRAGIRLQYFALIFSEGSLLVREKSASFRRSGGEWRVASFD